MTFIRTRASARGTLVACIIALLVASVAYRILIAGKLQHTSMVFIGIPALLALALTGVQPRTSVGTVNKTVAVALCLSGILFGEGFICILMASPLFFLIGTIVGKIRQAGDRADVAEGSKGGRWSRFGVVLLAPLCLEGVTPNFEASRSETVTVTRIVPASADAVRSALASPMLFDRPLPRFFKLGFPAPAHVAGAGLEVGSRRSIEFVHGRHHPGMLVLQVARSTPHSVTFTPVSDHSYITHWLSWREAAVDWTDMGDGRTRVTWTLRYDRRLDPAFYFKPLERYGVSLAARYLIETLATPRGG